MHLLCVKNGAQSKGIGFEIWKQIEEKYPNTIKWHTCTPYFETRNIYFYVNKCGFHITKFENDREEFPSDFVGDGGEGMFKFEKVMK